MVTLFEESKNKSDSDNYTSSYTSDDYVLLDSDTEIKSPNKSQVAKATKTLSKQESSNKLNNKSGKKVQINLAPLRP